MLKDWWQNLAEREQRMVSIGGSVVTVLLIYALIWTPLSSMVTQKRDAVQKQASLLSFLNRSAVTISQLRARGVDVVADDSQDVTTHAETVFSSQGISPFIKQVQQPSTNTVIFTMSETVKPEDSTTAFTLSRD